MNDMIYHMYREQRRILNSPAEEDNEALKHFRVEVQQAVEIIDLGMPEYKARYEEECAMQASFTPEQIDFICYQIGDWYLAWKHRIVTDLEKGTHRLGYAKEQLKSMICGER